MGAHEAGKPSMQLGVSGTGFTGGGGSDSTGGGTGSSGGVCSTIVCASQ